MIKAFNCQLHVREKWLLSSLRYRKLQKASQSFLFLLSSYSSVGSSICNYKPNKSLKIQREQMWCAYHSLRTIIDPHSKVVDFHIDHYWRATTNPLCYIQYIKHQFFHRLIRRQFSLVDEQVVPVQQQALMYEEHNALHYTTEAVY